MCARASSPLPGTGCICPGRGPASSSTPPQFHPCKRRWRRWRQAAAAAAARRRRARTASSSETCWTKFLRGRPARPPRVRLCAARGSALNKVGQFGRPGRPPARLWTSAALVERPRQRREGGRARTRGESVNTRSCSGEEKRGDEERPASASARRSPLLRRAHGKATSRRGAPARRTRCSSRFHLTPLLAPRCRSLHSTCPAALRKRPGWGCRGSFA